jgi:hypothetical protein
MLFFCGRDWWGSEDCLSQIDGWMDVLGGVMLLFGISIGELHEVDAVAMSLEWSVGEEGMLRSAACFQMIQSSPLESTTRQRPPANSRELTLCASWRRC